MTLWQKIASLILNHRRPWLVALAVATAFMGYQAAHIRLSYELAKILPPSDPSYASYEAFKSRFGEDGSVLVVGIETDRMYTLPFFNDWYDLVQAVRRIDGIKDVAANATLYNIVRNDSLERFQFRPLFAQKPVSQPQLDSLGEVFRSLPVYKGFIYNEKGNAHLMLVTFDQRTLNSKDRIGIVNGIRALGDAFAAKHALTVHYSGMPFIRTATMQLVSNEMVLFLALAIGVTAAILLALFRSARVVFFAMLVVLIGIVWSVGTIVLFGYNLTLLSGLIPPLIVVIGVPNSIFLLNKYQEEYVQHGDQPRALRTAIEKIGVTTFLANVTTSIGFAVFYFTGSALLMEFGLVAALNIMATYAVSLVLVPIVFSYLNPPSPKHVQHLEGAFITRLLSLIDFVVHHRRGVIYGTVAGLAVISLWGILKITAVGYVVDDLPQNNKIYTDLKFFEKNFEGVIPFEIALDTRQPGGVLNPRTLTKIRVLEKELAKYDEFTPPLSVVRGIKFFYQAYKGGNPKYFILPGNLELNKLTRYTEGLNGNEDRFKSLLDSTRRYTRVSLQMADIGSVETRRLLDKLQPKVDSIFNFDYETNRWVPPAEQYGAQITGASVIFTKGNAYLLKNLRESIVLALVLISIVMALQFASFRMIAISMVPSLVPLLITAGIMGYFGIALKPSTILIFSIAFGISSDGTIYFLTKYKEETKFNGLSISQAVSRTIMTTGVSMVYTAAILFAGFAIFAASTFQGTVALGVLVSITLLMSMVSNLVLLPAFLLTLEKGTARRAAKLEARVS